VTSKTSFESLEQQLIAFINSQTFKGQEGHYMNTVANDEEDDLPKLGNMEIKNIVLVGTKVDLPQKKKV
jgi:hypothetical protein